MLFMLQCATGLNSKRVKMSIKVNSFLGKIGWLARKHFPVLTSEAYLKLQFITRRKLQQTYINYFMNAKEIPKPNVVNIETINRCNSTCAFCNASIQHEKRLLCKIDDNLYKNIIDQLADWDYKGHLAIYGNNEPWLDSEIIERHKYARKKLPNNFIFMSTNGLLLDVDKVKQIEPFINQLIINNYNIDFKLHDNIKKIYDYVNANPNEFKNLDIVIQMRYLNEILTNRAGTAPNKKSCNKIIKDTCILPFTDMWIMPNGKLGLCCCDNYEVTEFADLTKTSLKDAWGSDLFMAVRKKIANGRYNESFCKNCDFIDAGFRTTIIKAILEGRNPNQLGGHIRMGLLKKED